MKKLFLLGTAILAITSTVVSAETMTADSMKEAFSKFLTTQTQMGALFDVNQVQVEANGKDFSVTLPAIETDKIKVPTRTIQLTEAGQFNNHTQYKINSVMETIQAMFKDLMPGSTFTTQSADSNMIWVPDYNLIVNNSQNIKGLVIDIPDMFRMTADSVVADTLVRATAENKMEKADSQDGTGVVITANTLQLTIPSVSYSDQVIGSDLTGDSVAQLLSSSSTTYRMELPTVLVGVPGGKESMGSLSAKSNGSFENDTFHFELTLDDIVPAGALKMMVSPVLTPTEVKVDLDIEGFNKESFGEAFTIMKSGKTEDVEEVQKTMQKAMENVVVKINLIDIKNNEAGVSVSGTIQNQKKENGEEEPNVNAKVVFTNLDKISPVPVVDEVRCARTKEQMAMISDKELAEKAIESACAPHGGILDDIRPYLNPEDRVVNADGTTLDTLTISTKEGTVIVNGKEFQ